MSPLNCGGVVLHLGRHAGQAHSYLGHLGRHFGWYMGLGLGLGLGLGIGIGLGLGFGLGLGIGLGLGWGGLHRDWLPRPREPPIEPQLLSLPPIAPRLPM